MHRIEIDPKDPKSVEHALNTEWLLTNGLGGYAMGTLLGVNTRRYHGLLVAATKPPVGRIVALHSMIEQLVIPRDDGSEEVIDLSTQQFVGPPPDHDPVLHPEGWGRLISFMVSPEGVDWEWRLGDVGIFKHVTIPGGRNSAYLSYLVTGRSAGSFVRLRPILSIRDFHSLGLPNEPAIRVSENGWHLNREEWRVDLEIRDKAPADWRVDPQWWNRFAYRQDRNRGQEWVEDLWSPGTIEFHGEHLTIRAAFIEPHMEAPSALTRMLDFYTPTDRPQTDESVLKWAAKDFIVTRLHKTERHVSVIAGYPWFGDWGRDTMIALPGLMLCTGRLDDACSTLLTFARNIRNGLIPNLFDDYGGAAHYNTVDASLWFVHAVHELWKATDPLSPSGRGVRGEGGSFPSPRGRGEFDELLTACRAIIAAYRHGTDFNIRMDPHDYLITAGDESTQLTWMDAKRDGITFTPRYGKPVEINALWHNALLCLAAMTDDTAEPTDLVDLAAHAATSFRAKFWWSERQCLHDCLTPGGAGFQPAEEPVTNVIERGGRPKACPTGEIPDLKIRPNQIFAASLPFSPLNDAQRRAIVKVVGERLLTPFGLRTLDREDPQYRPRYEGNLFDRDSAYHQGTVWPWLIGPYCEALLRSEAFSDAAKQSVRKLLQPLLDEMSNTEGGRCLGQIAEVYDGDPPHRPSGCPAQAWSVAEVLRAMTMIES